MKNRVQIGTCSGPAEAAFVRSVFDAHELPVVINGEMHASAMGGLAGFIRLNILVDQDDAEEAVALLRDIREGAHAVSEDDDVSGEAAAVDGDERADADGEWGIRPEASEASLAVVAPVPTTGFDLRRRRTGIALLLAGLAGFGTAHMSTGAWGRGFGLAVIQVAGIAYVASDEIVLGGWLLFGARFGDMFGALWRIWSSPAGDRALG